MFPQYVGKMCSQKYSGLSELDEDEQNDEEGKGTDPTAWSRRGGGEARMST